MTWDNPHPIANPYNTRAYGNFNINKQMQSSFYINRNCELRVPESRPYDPNIGQQQDLHVPNQLPLNSPGIMQPMQSSRFVTLPDGSVMDIQTRKTIYNPTKTDDMCWGSRMIPRLSDGENVWNDNDIYGPITPTDIPNQQIQLSKQDLEYQKLKDKNDEYLRNNMTDVQKQMLARLDNGGFVVKSRLVDESIRR